MKTVISFLVFAGVASAQCGPNGTIIGIGKAGDILCTGKTGATGFAKTFTGVATITSTAAEHGQGTKPVGYCYDNGTPALAIAQTATYPQVAANGDITFAWTGNKTGTCIISALGTAVGPQGEKGDTGDTGAAGAAGPAPAGTGVVKVTAGVPALVIGTATDCVRVDGTSGACGTGGGGGGGALSWATLTSSQWAVLTSSQWAVLTP